MGKKGIFEHVNVQYKEEQGKDRLPVTKYVVVSDKGRGEILRVRRQLEEAGFSWFGPQSQLYVLADNFNQRMVDALKKVNQDLSEDNEEELQTAQTIADELDAVLEKVKAAQPVLVDRDELFKDLENLIRGLENEDTAQQYINKVLDFSNRFYKYSMENVLLILAQKPEAKFVASRKDWRRKFGRVVIDPKDVITINCQNKWYINNRGKRTEYTIDQQQADDKYEAEVAAGVRRPNPRYEAKMNMRKRVIDTTYDECPVYEYSNTRGRELPAQAEANVSLDFTGTNQEAPDGYSDENARILFAIAKKSLEQDGIAVTQNPSTAGEMGWSRGNQINVSSDLAGANPAEVILNEWAYDLLFKQGGEFYNDVENQLANANYTPQQLIQTKEVMALTVAAALCRKYGVPVTVRPRRTELLQAQGGLNNREITEKNLNIIVGVMKHIKEKIDRNRDAVMAEMEDNEQQPEQGGTQ